ncbi:MAG: hypothetical protein LBG58_13270 [Planctomycetaceae bacterium]|nr:hypothetical protein [Planctomycetaceae bacterium]
MLTKINLIADVTVKAKNIFLCLLLGAILTVIGCGNPEIHGQVVFSDDKSPLNCGMVIFASENHTARGPIDKNGNYVVGSNRAKDGLPAGEYKVYIINTEIFYPPDSGKPLYERVIHPKYENPETSGFVLNVKSSQVFNIEVERYNASVNSMEKH